MSTLLFCYLYLDFVHAKQRWCRRQQHARHPLKTNPIDRAEQSAGQRLSPAHARPTTRKSHHHRLLHCIASASFSALSHGHDLLLLGLEHLLHRLGELVGQLLHRLLPLRRLILPDRLVLLQLCDSEAMGGKTTDVMLVRLRTGRTDTHVPSNHTFLIFSTASRRMLRTATLPSSPMPLAIFVSSFRRSSVSGGMFSRSRLGVEGKEGALGLVGVGV